MRGEERKGRRGENASGALSPPAFAAAALEGRNFDLLAPPVFNVFHHLAHRLARETETKGEVLRRRPLMQCFAHSPACAHTRPGNSLTLLIERIQRSSDAMLRVVDAVRTI